CYRIELLLRFDNNTTTLLNKSRISDEVAVNTGFGLECKSQHRLVSGDLNVTCTSYAGWTGKFPICRQMDRLLQSERKKKRSPRRITRI
uniref:Sushi domain-containing protein n=1 Tax=Magallana gigas TaxID=29159 RepID=A0A8W8M6Y2_MAGGI